MPSLITGPFLDLLAQIPDPCATPPLLCLNGKGGQEHVLLCMGGGGLTFLGKEHRGEGRDRRAAKAGRFTEASSKQSQGCCLWGNGGVRP